MLASLGQWLVATRSRLSLGQQLTILSCAICMLIVLAAATIAGSTARSNSAQSASSALASIAEGLAERLDYCLYERYRELRNLEGLAPLRATWSGRAQDVQTVLEGLQTTFIDYAWIGLADTNGKVLAATHGLLAGADVSERPWFRSGLKSQTVTDLHDATLLAKLLGPDENGEPFRFVDISLPVHDAHGKVTGVLGAHLSWAWIQRTRSALLDQIPAQSQIEAWLLRSNGEVILGPKNGSHPFTDLEIRRATAGEVVTVARDGALYALQSTRGYLDYPGLGWIVVTKQPYAVAMEAADALYWHILLGGLVIALLGALAYAFVSMRLTGPVHQLAIDIDSLGRDTSLAAVRRWNSSSDLINLSAALRALARRTDAAEEAQFTTRKSSEDAVHRLEEKNRRLGEDMSTLRALADTDPLTTLLNRRAFNVFAQDAFQHFRRYHRQFAVLVVDIDFFKRVNDSYGHGAGDEVIQRVASILSSSVRTDKIARFGGEEFVIMLREISPPDAAQLAERMRRTISDNFIDTKANGPIHITASIGMAFAGQGDRDMGDIVDRADRALYRAKSQGRNQVVVDWPEPNIRAVA